MHERFIIVAGAIGNPASPAADRAATGHKYGADGRDGIVSVVAVFGATLRQAHEIGLQGFQGTSCAVEAGKIRVIGSVIRDETKEAAAFPLRAFDFSGEHAAANGDEPGRFPQNAIRTHPVRCRPT